MNKKYLLAFLLLTLAVLPLAAFPSTVWAQGANLCDILNALGTALRGIAVAVATISFAIAGYMYLTSMGDSGKMNTAKTAVIAGIIGIAIVLLAGNIAGVAQELLGQSVTGCN